MTHNSPIAHGKDARFKSQKKNSTGSLKVAEHNPKRKQTQKRKHNTSTPSWSNSNDSFHFIELKLQLLFLVDAIINCAVPFSLFTNQQPPLVVTNDNDTGTKPDTWALQLLTNSPLLNSIFLHDTYDVIARISLIFPPSCIEIKVVSWSNFCWLMCCVFYFVLAFFFYFCLIHLFIYFFAFSLLRLLSLVVVCTFRPLEQSSN